MVNSGLCFLLSLKSGMHMLLVFLIPSGKTCEIMVPICHNVVKINGLF